MNMEPIFLVSVYDGLFRNYVSYDSYEFSTIEEARVVAKRDVSKHITVSARVEIGNWNNDDECYYYKTLETYGRKNPFRRKLNN